MAKEAKPKTRPLPPTVLTVGWVVLVIGILTLLYGGGRLLFVLSMDFTPQMISFGTSVDPACIEAAEDPSTCEAVFFGLIEDFSAGQQLSYTSREEFEADVETLRAQQRILSAIILIAGTAVAALGLSLVATGEHQRRAGRKRSASEQPRRSTQRRRGSSARG